MNRGKIPGKYLNHSGNMEPPNILRYHHLRKPSAAYFAVSGGMEVLGLQNLPADGKAMMIPSNHESWLDIPAHGEAAWKARIYLRMLAKTALWDLRAIGPYFGDFLEGAGAVPTLREGHAVTPQVGERMDKLVSNDAAIVNFIQKSRKNHEPYLVGKEVGPGAALIAMTYGLPLYPAGVAGTREKSFITVSYGEKIPVDKYDIDHSDRRSITKDVVADARELTQVMKNEVQINVDIAKEARASRLPGARLRSARRT